MLECPRDCIIDTKLQRLLLVGALQGNFTVAPVKESINLFSETDLPSSFGNATKFRDLEMDLKELKKEEKSFGTSRGFWAKHRHQIIWWLGLVAVATVGSICICLIFRYRLFCRKWWVTSSPQPKEQDMEMHLVGESSSDFEKLQETHLRDIRELSDKLDVSEEASKSSMAGLQVRIHELEDSIKHLRYVISRHATLASYLRRKAS